MSNNTNDPQRAAVGTIYKIRFDEYGHALEHQRPQEYTVQAKCTENPHGGIWHCTTHEQKFMNNLQKDGHLGAIRNRQKHAGVCYLAWFCFDHGTAEVP